MPIAKINLTGTHVQHGFLKVRVDLYPSPTNKTYALHYVDEVDAEGKPTGVKKLNPCLCHFIKIDPQTTKAELEHIIRDTFDADTVSQLDDALSEVTFEKRSRAGVIMRSKAGEGRVLSVQPKIENINKRFAGLEVEVG
jgi:hypothetical protein